MTLLLGSYVSVRRSCKKHTSFLLASQVASVTCDFPLECYEVCQLPLKADVHTQARYTMNTQAHSSGLWKLKKNLASEWVLGQPAKLKIRFLSFLKNLLRHIIVHVACVQTQHCFSPMHIQKEGLCTYTHLQLLSLQTKIAISSKGLVSQTGSITCQSDVFNNCNLICLHWSRYRILTFLLFSQVCPHP